MTHTHTHTHTQTNKQKKQLYRWIGLAIGLILGLTASFFYYQWVKKSAAIHFQKNIGEVGFQTELQKWQVKNPQQAIILATEIQKALGIYEELRDETDPEKIQKRAFQRLQEMSEEEKKEYGKKVIEIYQENAPSVLKELEKKFPWYLRYYWVVIILLVLVMVTAGFGLGYFFEPEEEINR